MILTEDIENTETKWGVSLSSHNPEPEDYIACASREDAERLINRCVRRLTIVPATTSADDANRLYGEAFGVDWNYEK